VPVIAGLPPFQGGIAGYIGYEALHGLEGIPADGIDDLGFPAHFLGLYPTLIAFDTRERKAWVVDHGTGRLAAFKERYVLSAGLGPPAECPAITVTPDEAPEQFLDNIIKIKEYILDGDIFQANLCQRFSAPTPDGIDPYALFLRLRRNNPAPFAAYFSLPHGQILSASPELFARLENGTVLTRPIKGTKRRLAQTDAETVAALRNSPKDRAENLMIVDLLRHDLARICRPGTVLVSGLFDCESFSTVHHLVSTIHGRVLADSTPYRVLAAMFPGGSVTGAPKIRAMQIIAELEKYRRGVYCGTLCTIGFDGSLTGSIAIRTMLCNGKKLAFHTGCGIVADSDPQHEYQESLDKAAGLLQACLGQQLTQR
jgi:para-aminobenzoate synthetase component 1